MSFVSKIVALSLLSVAFATPLGTAPITLDLHPIGRRQAGASEAAIQFSNITAAFFTPVRVGANTFNLAVNIYEPDTWIISEQVQCKPPPGARDPPPCEFGAKYKLPGSFAKINGAAYQHPERGGPSGVLGSETISVAGITVPNQVVALISSMYSEDDSVSGQLGLGTLLGPAYSGSKYQNRSQFNFEPIFPNMVIQKLIQRPVFSLTLGTNGGALAFGGLPRGFNAASLATAPAINGSWVVKADGIVLDGQNRPGALELSVDVNNPEMRLPKPIAQAFNAKIPGSTLRKNPDPAQGGMWTVPCGAKAPSVGIVFGGKTITFNPSELIVPDLGIKGSCVSLIGEAAGPHSMSLGFGSLNDLVIVYDVLKKTISFGTK